ncbi:hypothetical protein [Clavibacter zhangzhiyongii]|uniref:hypothetical protein n=1 Tax=Clavibacter zhangzhiyongii TaxID=2768071 RepID=UPI0039DF7287
MDDAGRSPDDRALGSPTSRGRGRAPRIPTPAAAGQLATWSITGPRRARPRLVRGARR